MFKTPTSGLQLISPSIVSPVYVFMYDPTLIPPAKLILPPTPTPPVTTNAPVSVEVDAVLLVVWIISSVLISVVVTVVSCIVNFCATISPPTYKSPPMPTPPETCSAPVLVDVEDEVVDINKSVVRNALVDLNNKFAVEVVPYPAVWNPTSISDPAFQYLIPPLLESPLSNANTWPIIF